MNSLHSLKKDKGKGLRMLMHTYDHSNQEAEARRIASLRTAWPAS
jgi:hypothetical protein